MDDEGDRPTWERAVAEVADREGVEPTALEPPLGAVIDPAAAESVLASAREFGTSASVTFDYNGYEVTLRSDGDVTVSPSGED